MKRTALVILAIAVLGTACKKADPPTSSGLGLPTTFSFTGTGLPANELPPITSTENTGRAFFNATMRVTRDGGGTITGGTVDYGVAVSGFPSTIVYTNMHIHRGDAATNGPILVLSGLTNADLADGFTERTNNAVSAADAQAIIANPAGFYFNIHSQQHGGGVARAQLVLAGQQ